jgi:Leucine-rich repeat (LRR) protein
MAKRTVTQKPTSKIEDGSMEEQINTSMEGQKSKETKQRLNTLLNMNYHKKTDLFSQTEYRDIANNYFWERTCGNCFRNIISNISDPIVASDILTIYHNHHHWNKDARFPPYRDLISLLQDKNIINEFLIKSQDITDNILQEHVKEALLQRMKVLDQKETNKEIIQATKVIDYSKRVLWSNFEIQWDLSLVEELSLSNSYLWRPWDKYENRLPVWILQLRNLKKLRIDNNYIDNLPDDISNLDNLEELYLHNTYINSLPSSISKLKKLKIIVLNHYMSNEYAHVIKKYLPPDCDINITRKKNQWSEKNQNTITITKNLNDINNKDIEWSKI